MNPIRASSGLRRLRFMVLGIVGVALAAALLGTYLLSDPDEPSASIDETFHFTDISPRSAAVAPVALTGDECLAKRPLMEKSIEQFRKELAAKSEALARQLDASAERSRVWFDAGCPADPVLGKYPAPDGKGGQYRLLDQTEYTIPTP